MDTIVALCVEKGKADFDLNVYHIKDMSHDRQLSIYPSLIEEPLHKDAREAADNSEEDI